MDGIAELLLYIADAVIQLVEGKSLKWDRGDQQNRRPFYQIQYQSHYPSNSSSEVKCTYAYDVSGLQTWLRKPDGILYSD